MCIWGGGRASYQNPRQGLGQDKGDPVGMTAGAQATLSLLVIGQALHCSGTRSLKRQGSYLPTGWMWTSKQGHVCEIPQKRSTQCRGVCMAITTHRRGHITRHQQRGRTLEQSEGRHRVEGNFTHVVYYKNERASLPYCLLCSKHRAWPLATSVGCNTEESVPGQKAVVSIEVFSSL